MHLSRNFLRAFVAAGAWTALPAGLYLVAAGFPVALLLVVGGLALAYLVLQPKGLKVGEYDRFQMILIALGGVAMLGMGLFMRVLIRGPATVVWVAYLVGIVILLGIAIAHLRKQTGQT